MAESKETKTELLNEANAASFGIDEDDSSQVLQQPLSQPPSSVGKQPGGDLATANRLLKSCRVLIDQLNKQLANEKEESAKIREEFQKYRIRVELARKNSELEITSLSEVNLKFKQYNVVSHDVHAELEMFRRRFEIVDRERTEASAEAAKLARQLAHEKSLRAQAEHEMDEMRKTADMVGSEALTRAKSELMDELNEIKREFRSFRERSGKMLEEKDAEIVRARTSTEASTELAYLRDVVLKYLASVNDQNAKTSMEAAIATVLRFNQAEMDFIKEKRRSDAGWKAPLSSLGM